MSEDGYDNKKLALVLTVLVFSASAFSAGIIIGQTEISPYDFVKNVSKKILNQHSDSSASQVVSAENYEINEIENNAFTIVSLPDTQIYSLSFPKVFENITEWIVSNENKWRIEFVTHEGDLVQHHTSETQWKNAKRSMRNLDNFVPYGFCAGNHDMDSDKSAIKMKQYFPCEYYQKNWGDEYWGSCYQGTKNNYQIISTSRMNILLLHLEYSPSEKVLDWAEKVLENHPDSWSIITTHNYLNLEGEKTDAGERIWKNLVTPYPNVHLVLCGHNHGEARRQDTVDNRIVNQVLSDYQDRPNGGNGWIRLLVFHPSENEINIRTYSPYLNAFETDNNSQFSIKWS